MKKVKCTKKFTPELFMLKKTLNNNTYATEGK